MFHSTTILLVKHKEEVAMGGDGQVTFGNTVIKQRAKKIRKMYHNKIIAGFAGSAADAFSLFAKFEEKLENYNGNIQRAAIELAKDWRMDRILRRLEAMLIVSDKENTFLLSGSGDIIEPDDGIIAIGSGGHYAMAAGKALLKHSSLSAKEIVLESMKIASDICIYTNSEIIVEEL